MTRVIDDLLERGAAAGVKPLQPLEKAPRLKVAVVTCMDARLDPSVALALELGEAHIIRNAGGVVSDDVIRSLAISQRKLGTRAVMIIQHTDCGMLSLSDDEFRAELLADTGVAPPFAIESFTDLDQNVRQSVLRVRRSPFLPHHDQVRGFVLDVDHGGLREVAVEGD
jgi:carbonic anhydrase